MKAWISGTTWETEPGPSGVGIVYDNNVDLCMSLSGWKTKQSTEWHALLLAVEYFVTEFEWDDVITVYVSDPEIVKLANRRTKRGLGTQPLEFFYLKKIAKQMMHRKVEVVLGEVSRAEPIANAAAEIAADAVGSEETGGSEGAGPG